MSDKKYTILMTGKTGVGKSALGNSILGHITFLSCDAGESVTTECVSGVVNRSGLNITVVDTPGFFDTSVPPDEAKLKALKDIKNAMTKCDTDGKLAVIFVIKYGERFTEENMKTLQILEHIFGKENIWKSCVLVMTHGESFDLNNEKKSFDQYLKEADGELGELFKKCNYKCVLFYNKTVDVNKKNEQWQSLIKFVQDLNQSYTRDKFEAAKKEQNRIELESKISNHKNEFREKLDKINTELENLNLNHESLDDLKNIENHIVQNLNIVNDLDSPEIIYYEKDEKRLLDDICTRFESLKQLTLKKQKIVEQLKSKEELTNTINAISDDIQTIDPEATNAFDIIVKLEMEISSIDKTRQDKKLNVENDKHVSLQIKLCQNELERVKEKIIEQKENYITLQVQIFQKTLFGIKEEHSDKEILLKLKDECVVLKNKIENDKTILRKDFLEIQENYLLLILDEISKKHSGILQKEKLDEFKKEIFAIENEIKSSPSVNSEINKLVSILDAKLNDINEKIEAQISRLDLKTQLINSIKSVRVELENLERKVKFSKENEIHNVVNEIKERFKNLKYDDKNFEKTRKELEDEIDAYSNTLHLEENDIDKHIFNTTIEKLSKIKSEFEKKCAQHEQFLLIQKFTKKLDKIKNEILETDITDEKSHEHMETLQEELNKIEQEINYAQLEQANKIDLKDEIQNIKDEIKRGLKNIASNTEREKLRQIVDIISKTKKTKYSHEDATSILSSLKNDLFFFIKSLDENNVNILRSKFERLLKEAEEEIENLEKQIQQFELFKHYKSEIERLIPQKGETLQTTYTDSALLNVLNNKKKLKELKKTSGEKITQNPFKHMILNELREAKEKISILKSKVMENQKNSFYSIIQNFDLNLQVIINSKINVSEQLHKLKKQIDGFKSNVKSELKSGFQKDILQKVDILLKKINNQFENLRQSKRSADIIN